MANSTLRVLSYNIFWGGHQQPLEQTIEVIRKSGADLVGIQENVNRDYEDQTPALAKALGFSYVRHAMLDAPGRPSNALRPRCTGGGRGLCHNACYRTFHLGEHQPPRVVVTRRGD